MFCYPTEYEMGIYPMQQGDIVEIDSLEELVTMGCIVSNLLEGRPIMNNELEKIVKR